MTYKRWEVVAVPFPFIEWTDAKRRPALIVSADALRDRYGLYWTVMITTARAGAREGDIRIEDHRAAGLPDACVIRPSIIATLSAAQIARRLGTVSSALRNAVSARLKAVLP